MPPTTHLVETLFDRPIAFHRIFAKFTGSLNAGLMLSQAVFWSKRTKDEYGWFYKSQSEWEDEICLTRREQDTARLALRRWRKRANGQPLPPFWFEERRGIPARLFYRVDMDALMIHLEAYHSSDAQKRQTEDDVQPDLTGVPAMGNAQKRQSCLAENAKLDATKTPIRVGGKRQSGLAESANHSLQRIHAKTTTKSSSSSTRARANGSAAAASQFSEIEINDYLAATKPHNQARNSGLAHKLWLTGEDDHLMAHWQQQQQQRHAQLQRQAEHEHQEHLRVALELADLLLSASPLELTEHAALLPGLLETLSTSPAHAAVVAQLKGLP